jgi:hypothetical protein
VLRESVRSIQYGERLVDILLTKGIRSMQLDFVLLVGRKLLHKYHLRVLIAKKIKGYLGRKLWGNSYSKKKNRLLG